MKSKLKGNLLLLITAAIWGFAFAAQSVGIEMLTPCSFNGIRSIIGAVVLIPVVMALSRNNLKDIKMRKRTIKGGIYCGIVLCLASTMQSIGLLYCSAGKSAFITALYIVIVPIISVFLKKKPNIINIISVIIAITGFYLLCGESGAFSIGIGEIVLFISSVLFACHIIVIDNFAENTDGTAMSMIQFFVVGILNLTYVSFFESIDLNIVMQCWLPILYAGALSCGVAYTLQIIAQKYTDATSASLIMSLESVFGALGGWLFLRQTLTFREISGCIIVFTAIILVQIPVRRKL